MLPRIKLIWYHILLPLTAWIYLSAAIGEGGVLQKAQLVALLLAVVIFTGINGYLINDLFDRKKDYLAGKPNFFNHLGGFSWPLAAFFCVVTVGLWVVLQPSATVLALLGLQLLLLLLYSVPGVRLKERVAGLVADALYSRVVPAVVLLLLGGATISNAFFWVTLCAWLLVAGLRNIILHQIDDRRGDRASSSNNWVLWRGALWSANFVVYVLIPLELALLVVWGFVAWPVLPGVAVFCLLAMMVIGLCYCLWERPPYNVRWWKRKMLYLPNHAYEEWLPLFCLASLAISNPGFIWLLPLHLLLFYKVWYKYYYPVLLFLGVAARFVGSSVRLAVSRVVNYGLYYGFKAFKVDLKRENTTAFKYLREKIYQTHPSQ